MSEAKKITDSLLEQKLIACVNFFPITSEYWWKGKIETAQEVTAVLKTKKDNWTVVKEYIEKNHAYETPCVIKLAEVEANTAYENWIEEVTGF